MTRNDNRKLQGGLKTQQAFLENVEEFIFKFDFIMIFGSIWQDLRPTAVTNYEKNNSINIKWFLYYIYKLFPLKIEEFP